MMEKTFVPQAVEVPLYKRWEQAGCFKPAPQQQQQNHFSMVIPPPNVTGRLHMGHAFENTLMDILVRYHRACGDRTMWLPGTDHAGIATQILVERQLRAQQQSRHELGRDAFIERVWQWKHESGNAITGQLRRLGASLDWSRERFTMEPKLNTAVTKVFVDLYREQLIYRGKRLVNWDPSLLTSVSDLEVQSEEEAGSLWHIRYPLVQADAKMTYLVVATTRPETLFGDVAVAVHPEDPRYQHLIGQQVKLPLTERTISIIADDYVDPEFGTGCVKITPAHDFNDYQVGQRHQLEMINVLDLDGKLNEQASAEFRGIDRLIARPEIVEALEAQSLLDSIEPHTLKVPRGERSGAVIEPMLTDQWFVDAVSLAKPAIAAVKSGDIEFVPKNWENTYFAWMENIQDWCISRQLWWGHRIPAWYDAAGKVYVGLNETEVREHYKLAADFELTQDEDVLDTWFSAGLWTFATAGWPEKTADLADFHPTNVLVTGFDIIFFWVARMIMLTLHFTKQVPFNKVYIHGLIRDSEGQKMSKSKGNVLDPIDLIDGIELDALLAKRTQNMLFENQIKQITKATKKEFPTGIASYGTDALRFTFASLANTGRDIRFDIGRVEGYRNFCNKLWNAARFVHMTCLQADSKPVQLTELKPSSLTDRWILSRLQTTIEKAHLAMATFRFDLLAQAVYQFTWHEFCDWYLELSKVTLYDKSESAAIQTAQQQTRQVAVTVLDQILRLMQPIMPYITQTIWQTLPNQDSNFLMLAAFPRHTSELVDLASEETVQWLQALVTGVRTIRGEMNIAFSKPVQLLLQGGQQRDQADVEQHQAFIKALIGAKEISWIEAGQSAPTSASFLVGELQVFVPLAGLVDSTAEITRLKKSLAKQVQEQARTRARLDNSKFVDNAPAEVVTQVRESLAQLEQSIEHNQKQLAQLHQLSAL